MADIYVWSGASGSGTGADWTNAYTNLAAAASAGAAGDRFFIAHDHSYSYSTSTTIGLKGSAASPCQYLCVNRAGSVPPVEADLRTTAVEATNAASTNILVPGSGSTYYYMYGITFSAGAGQSTTCNLSMNSNGFCVYERCVFKLATTGTGSRITPAGTTGNYTILKACQFYFGATAQGLNGSATNITIEFCGDGLAFLASGSATPTGLWKTNSGTNVLIRGYDLSAYSSQLLPGGGSNVSKVEYCKIHASATLDTTPANPNRGPSYMIGCDSGGAVARNEITAYQGRLTTETTIKRTGGASDGTTGYSWKIVANANNELAAPFDTSPFLGDIWNDATGSSKTLTVHCVTDNVTLKDSEIWLEVEYLGSSGGPYVTAVSDGKIVAGANQASSTETWTTTGLTTPVKQKLEVSFTPQMAGPIRWRVKYAKVSSTVYVCPKAELS